MIVIVSYEEFVINYMKDILSRQSTIFAIIALIIAFALTSGLATEPNYTDAYYHFNAAERLVNGDGLTDAYLWTYIGEPETLPAPSHLYWMPLTSLLTAFGMWLMDAPQLMFTLMLAATACVAYWLGGNIGGKSRHMWVAGLLTLFAGFFARFWGMSDTFTPYALIGSLTLVCIGQGVRYGGLRWWALAGALTGLAHLTRVDGVLLLLIGWIAILWPSQKSISSKTRATNILIMMFAYLLLLMPWFVRNMDVSGTPLATGGIDSIWFTSYDDLFNYPPGASTDAFTISTFIESRWAALTNNLGTFVAVEGLIAMTPLMLAGLWIRRREPFLRGFWLYALALHVVMTLVFPFAGYRGGLLHSAAALVPWWAALGIAGLDDAVDWMAKRRRTWKPNTAKPVFSIALVILAIVMSLAIGAKNRQQQTPPVYAQLADILPDDARVMINDPAELYYHTGLGGVVLPNEDPQIITEIAEKYDVTHLLIERVGDQWVFPQDFVFDVENLPDFLVFVAELTDARLYEIR
jgi:4-amino-4-deoxy-L-arabinose transferase-like glycosyltransferase